MSIFPRRLATVVSWLGHPLVFVTVSVAIVLLTRFNPRNALPILGVLFLAIIAPIGVLLFLGVRSGRWADADVSVREERKRFYPIAIPISAIGTFVMWLMHAPRGILRGGLITLALLVAAAIVNRWSKISLHSLFAVYCTTILFRVNFLCGVFSLILALLVFWSRLFLERHTLFENISGAFLGVIGGIAIA